MRIKEFLKKRWRNAAMIALLVCLIGSMAAPAMADVIRIQPVSVLNNLADDDGDTKIQVEESADEDKIRFDTGGTERMIIDNWGNVGFGTANPGREVEIYSASPTLRIRDSGATADSCVAYTEFGGTDAAAWSRTGFIGDSASANTNIKLVAEVGDLLLDAAGDIILTPGGNVGITADIDFDENKAIAMVCDNGATVPASATVGQWYLHTPTGRNILYQYDGSNWGPIISIGSMTVYVDKTDGTDGLDYGTGVDSDAFATVQYAVDCIPGTYGGNVIIYINNESYDETVTIRGKAATGSYTITLQGTLSQQDTATMDSAVKGMGATQGSITDTGKFGSYDNMLMYANSEYRIIDFDFANIATIVGTWSGVPSGTWIVYDWGTVINKISVEAGQKGIVLYDIELDTGVCLNVQSGSDVTAYRIKTTNSGSYSVRVHNSGTLNLRYSYMNGVAYVIEIHHFGYVFMGYSKVYTTSNGDRCVRLHDTGQMYMTYGCILDASTTINTYGIEAKAGCVANTGSTAVSGYNRIRNQGIGIYATAGGTIFKTLNNQYNGNTVDESPAGASDPAYID